MPSSLSSGDVRENSDSHEGNLDACLLRPRPMRVRKVVTSGTNGRGDGIAWGGRVLCRKRLCTLARHVFGATKRHGARKLGGFMSGKPNCDAFPH